MILKKPYAFFIKMFKPIHLVISILIAYLIYLDDICFKINSIPRKIFDFKCAYDVELDYD